MGTSRSLVWFLVFGCLLLPGRLVATSPAPLLVRLYPSPEEIVAEDSSIDWEVHDLVAADKRIWLATQQGVFRLAGEVRAKIEAIKPPAFAAEQVDTWVWVGALQGLYRIRTGVVERIPHPGPVEHVQVIPGLGVFATTPSGATFFPWAEATAPAIPSGRPITGLSSSVTVVARLSTGTWLGARDTLYQLDDALQATPVGTEPLGEVLFLEEWDDRVWFVVADRGTTSDGKLLMREADGTIRPVIEKYKGNVTFLEKAGSTLFLGTNRGLYEIEKLATGGYDGKPVAVPGLTDRWNPNNPINGLFVSADGQRYVVADSRLYWTDADAGFQAPPPSWPGRLRLSNGDFAEGMPMVWGGQGAFRLEKGGRIEVAFEGQLKDGKLIVPSEYLQVKDIRLLDEQGDPLPIQPLVGDFQLKVGCICLPLTPTQPVIGLGVANGP